jgi:anti-sigma-K factor RskA
MIRLALRDRVGRASPDPQVWERIQARMERLSTQRRRRGPDRWLAAFLMKRLWRAVVSFLAIHAESWKRPQTTWVEWRFDPYFTRLLINEYGFFFLRLAF